MVNYSKEEMILTLKPLLKAEKFKKKQSTWHKVSDDLVFVVNIQGSQWGPEYYINLAIYLRGLGSDIALASQHCHIFSRIMHEGKTCETIVEETLGWFQNHGCIEHLAALNKENKLPLTTHLAAVEYLKSIESKYECW